MKKRSPFRQTSSNQEGFGIQRNAKRKPVRKKTKKKSVTKKQGEATPLSELSNQDLVTFLASMPEVSQDNLNYLIESGRLGNLFTTQFDNEDPLFRKQLQSVFMKYGQMLN